jgi:dTMP kinase
MSGTFITFEGVEGCGKSTQIAMLTEHLKTKGRAVVLTREPGGTKISEKIREILLDSAHTDMDPVTELMLYAASRRQHVTEVIEPALAKGNIVLCDRYADATTAYQGAARDIDFKILGQLHEIATDGLMPEVTILLDCPAEVGLGRARSRNASDGAEGSSDRFEQEKMVFHKRVRDGYLAIANAERDRVHVVDATQSIEDMHSSIRTIIDERLGIRG